MILISCKKKNIPLKMNQTLHYCFTLTTVINTLCTLQNMTFTNCKNNSLHGKPTIGWPKTPCFSYLHRNTYLCPPLFTLLPPFPSLFLLSPPTSLLVQPLPTLHLLPPLHLTSSYPRPSSASSITGNGLLKS